MFSKRLPVQVTRRYQDIPALGGGGVGASLQAQKTEKETQQVPETQSNVYVTPPLLDTARLLQEYAQKKFGKPPVPPSFRGSSIAPSEVPPTLEGSGLGSSFSAPHGLFRDFPESVASTPRTALRGGRFNSSMESPSELRLVPRRYGSESLEEPFRVPETPRFSPPASIAPSEAPSEWGGLIDVLPPPAPAPAVSSMVESTGRLPFGEGYTSSPYQSQISTLSDAAEGMGLRSGAGVATEGVLTDALEALAI